MESRYYSLNNYLQETFQEKLYKISLDPGFTCPNRDGTLGTKGCIFCSSKGSGDFAEDHTLSITEQIEAGKERVAKKFKGHSYIAYFQAFTGTYGSIDWLRKSYQEAALHPDIKVISIATRPDCLSLEVLDLLTQIQQIKPLWIELGLQTIHEKSSAFIRRGYPLATFEEALKALKERHIPVITHLILGLPGEGLKENLETIAYINKQKIAGVKLHLLHILADTDLATYYQKHPFYVPTMEEYFALLSECINHLDPHIVIHRLTGDGDKKTLVAPLWTGNKRKVLNEMNHYFKNHHVQQGKENTDDRTF